jgi:hypothetical protein
MDNRLRFLSSIFSTATINRTHPDLHDLARTMNTTVESLWCYVRGYAPGRNNFSRDLVRAAATLLHLDERALRGYVNEGDPKIEKVLSGILERVRQPAFDDSYADRLRLILLPFVSKRAAGTRPSIIDVAATCGVSKDRLWKISRGLVLPPREEAERIAAAAAPHLNIGARTLSRFLSAHEARVAERLRAQVPPITQCTHCGTRGSATNPIVQDYAVHETCWPALIDEAQFEWVEEVEGELGNAPPLIRRAWRTLREADPEQPMNLFRVAMAAGIEYRLFVRLWILSGLPRRKVPRTRPEPLTHRLRLAWATEVDRQISQAPEQIRAVWWHARQAGVRLNMERLAEFAREPQWRFRRSWIQAGLPTPRSLDMEGGDQARE